MDYVTDGQRERPVNFCVEPFQKFFVLQHIGDVELQQLRLVLDRGVEAVDRETKVLMELSQRFRLVWPSDNDWSRRFRLGREILADDLDQGTVTDF